MKLGIVNSVKWSMLVLLTFCFIFAFPIPVAGNAAYVAMLCFFILVFTNSTALNNFLKLLKHKAFVVSLLSLSGFLAIALFVTVVNNAFDFTIVRPLVNNIASLLACVACVAYLLTLRGRKDAADLLVSILVAQSMIIFLMLLSADLREVIQALVRTDAEMERMASYNNVRGLGLSGSVAFGLSVTMGFLGFILHYWLAVNKSSMSSRKAFCIFVLCLLASLSAGRTAILGYVLGFVFYLPLSGMNSFLNKFFKQLVIGVVLLAILLIYIFSNEALRDIAFFYSRYVFQFVWQYLETGSVSLSSLEKLENMYFLPPESFWLFGYGKYTNPDGTYFMHTDAGYMRFLLFFGIAGSVLVYSAYLVTLSTLARYSSKTLKMPLVFLLTVFLISFIFHYKGELILFSVPFMKIIFVFYMYYIGAEILGFNKYSVTGAGAELNCEKS